MAGGDHYRVRAADCEARANRESDHVIRAEWEALAQSYRLLADHADRNAARLLPTVQQPPAQQQPQQQQQVQPEPPKPSE